MKNLNDFKDALRKNASGIEKLTPGEQKSIKGGSPGQYYSTLAECQEDCAGADVLGQGGGGWPEEFECEQVSAQSWLCSHVS